MVIFSVSANGLVQCACQKKTEIILVSGNHQGLYGWFCTAGHFLKHCVEKSTKHTNFFELCLAKVHFAVHLKKIHLYFPLQICNLPYSPSLKTNDHPETSSYCRSSFKKQNRRIFFSYWYFVSLYVVLGYKELRGSTNIWFVCAMGRPYCHTPSPLH